MSEIIPMSDSMKTARLAGFLYLVIIVAGIFGMVYVPATLIDWSDPKATMLAIKTRELLFRLGILATVVCYLSFILLPLVLFQLLNAISKRSAVLMVALALISIPVSLVNITHYLQVLALLEQPDYFAAMPLAQLQAQVMAQLRLYNDTNTMLEIFWGLWLLPFGYLIVRSDFLPKILGALLLVGGFGYLIEFFARFIFSQDSVPLYVSLPGTMGEFGTCLWLLIMGVKKFDWLGWPFTAVTQNRMM